MAGSFYGNPHFQLQIVEVFENKSDALAKLHTNEILEGQYCVIFQSGNPFIDGAIFKKVLYTERGIEYIEDDNQKVFAYKQITKIKGDPGFLILLGKFPTLEDLIDEATYGDSFNKIITEEVTVDEQTVTQEKIFNTLSDLQQYVAGLDRDLWFHITGKVGNDYYSYFGDTSNDGLSNDDNWILLPELNNESGLQPYGVAGCVLKSDGYYTLWACLPEKTKTNLDENGKIYYEALLDKENWVELNYNGIDDDNISYEYTWSSQKIQEEYTGIDHINDIEFGKIEGVRTFENVTDIDSLDALQNYVWGKISENASFNPSGYYWFIENSGYYWYDPPESVKHTDESAITDDDNWKNFQEGYNDYHIYGENEALLKHHKHGYLTTDGKLVDIDDSSFNSSDDPVMPESDELNYAEDLPVRTDENGNIIAEKDIPQFNHITGQLDGQIEVNGSSIKIYCNKKPNIVDGGIITGILGGNITDKFATVDVIYKYYTGENQDQEELIYYAYGNLFVYNNTVGFDNNALRAGQILMLYINVKENIGGTGNGADDQHPIFNNCEFHVINPQSMYEHSHYISSIKDIESGTWYPTFCGLDIDGNDIGTDTTGLVQDITSYIETQDMRGWYTRVGNTVTIGFQCSAKMIENMYDENNNQRLIAQIGIRGIPYKCVSRAGGGGVIFHVLQRLNKGCNYTNVKNNNQLPELPYVATSFYISAGEGVTNGADNTITVRRTSVGFPIGTHYDAADSHPEYGAGTNTELFQRNANLSVCYFPDKGTRFFLYGTICYQTDSSWSKINNVALDNEGGDSAYDQVSTLLAKLEQAEQRIGLLSSQVETILKNYGISSHN